MEKLWKHVHIPPLKENPLTTLALSLHEHHKRANNTNSKSIFSQDYLAEAPLLAPIVDQTDQHEEHDQEQTSGSPEGEKVVLNSVGTPAFMSSLNSPFETLGIAASSPTYSPSSLLSCLCSKSKRVYEDQTNDEPGFSRKHKRMMKNRESAARSRARRQAYTSELEREIVDLTEENAKLRKQQVELLLSETAGTPRKRTHNRSLTAPF